jgi:hypothetical protein
VGTNPWTSSKPQLKLVLVDEELVEDEEEVTFLVDLVELRPQPQPQLLEPMPLQELELEVPED